MASASPIDMLCTESIDSLPRYPVSPSPTPAEAWHDRESEGELCAMIEALDYPDEDVNSGWAGCKEPVNQFDVAEVGDTIYLHPEICIAAYVCPRCSEKHSWGENIDPRSVDFMLRPSPVRSIIAPCTLSSKLENNTPVNITLSFRHWQMKGANLPPRLSGCICANRHWSRLTVLLLTST